MERWLGRVKGAVIALADFLPAEALDKADHLIDHGEASLGLEALAWSIAKTGVQVPSWTIDLILDLSGNLIDPQDLPPDLRKFALDA